MWLGCTFLLIKILYFRKGIIITHKNEKQITEKLQKIDLNKLIYPNPQPTPKISPFKRSPLTILTLTPHLPPNPYPSEIIAKIKRRQTIATHEVKYGITQRDNLAESPPILPFRWRQTEIASKIGLIAEKVGEEIQGDGHRPPTLERFFKAYKQPTKIIIAKSSWKG